MAKRSIGKGLVKGLVKGVKATVEAKYKTSDGRVWTNGNHANRYQTYLNRREAVKEVLRNAGLLAYKSSDHILSVGPLADRILNDNFIAELTAAAKGRTPRLRTV